MLHPIDLTNLLNGSADELDLGWTLCCIGDSQEIKLAELVRELREDFSETGEGKKILSGFSYWGISPTIAWAKTCGDQLYPVMQQSITSFNKRWQQIHTKHLKNEKFHYLSLGVGTGEKDYQVLKSLLFTEPNLLYLPVDMSATMLRIAIRKVTEIEQLKRSQVLPIQIDFSDVNKIKQLRNLVDHLAENQSVLFSLLGNTLANFENDSSLLSSLSRLMRPQDFLLLEVATTEDLNHQVGQKAANEYKSIDSFKKFVTSALLQNTDFKLDLNNILCEYTLEEDKAILIKVIYKNLTQEIIKVRLPDWSLMDFCPNDTICLLITRKYIDKGIENLIANSSFSIVEKISSNFQTRNSQRQKGSSSQFGLDLILLSLQPKGSTSSGSERNISATVNEEAIAHWREKLFSYQKDEAIASDPEKKFQLKQLIKECQQKIQELGG